MTMFMRGNSSSGADNNMVTDRRCWGGGGGRALPTLHIWTLFLVVVPYGQEG